MAKRAKELLLAIGIGNTNVSLGIFQRGELLRHWRLSTEYRRTADEARVYLSQLLQLSELDAAQIRGLIIASDVPAMTGVYMQALRDLFGIKPLLLTHEIKLGIENCYQRPEQVGSDRLANAVAGKDLFGLPLIIVDIGTAITLDVINSKSQYLGGVIMPGPQMSAEALYQKAARLPQISFEETEQIIGRSTETSIRSGLFNGIVGSIDYLAEQIQKETGEKSKVVATGGLGEYVVRKSRYISQYHPNLNLLGLAKIWEMNR